MGVGQVDRAAGRQGREGRWVGREKNLIAAVRAVLLVWCGGGGGS